jgi:hypothetical protein
LKITTSFTTDSTFAKVASSFAALQIHEVVTAPRSPWQKGVRRAIHRVDLA